jgi:hypothetical protein
MWVFIRPGVVRSANGGKVKLRAAILSNSSFRCEVSVSRFAPEGAVTLEARRGVALRIA